MGDCTVRDVACLLRQSEEAAQKGDWKGSRTSLLAVLELQPTNPQALNRLGIIAFRCWHWQEAEECWRAALEDPDTREEAFYNLSYLYTIQGRPLSCRQLQQNFSELSGPSARTTGSKPSNLEGPNGEARPAIRAGFVSLWYERGQAYVTMALRAALDGVCETHVLARNGSSDGSRMVQTVHEWDVPNLTLAPRYEVDPEFFSRWVKDNRLDVVFFNEEPQFDLVKRAREQGARTLGYYVWELFDPRWVDTCNRLYDVILTQTEACHEHFKRLGLKNLHRLRWGVDLGLFRPTEARRPANRLRFFHPAGWGGLHARRGSRYVIDAFRRLRAQGAELVVHMQNGNGVEQEGQIQILRGNLPRTQLVRLYQCCDVAVLPSKWEGLGLTFLESLAAGLPVVSLDAPPMNEFVRDGENGFLCRVTSWKSYPGIFVRGAHPDIDHLTECMSRFADRGLLERMSRNARRYAEAHLDWASNGQVLQELVRHLFRSKDRAFGEPAVEDPERLSSTR